MSVNSDDWEESMQWESGEPPYWNSHFKSFHYENPYMWTVMEKSNFRCDIIEKERANAYRQGFCNVCLHQKVEDPRSGIYFKICHYSGLLFQMETTLT